MELLLLGCGGNIDTIYRRPCRCYDLQFTHKGMRKAQKAVNDYRADVLAAGQSRRTQGVGGGGPECLTHYTTPAWP